MKFTFSFPAAIATAMAAFTTPLLAEEDPAEIAIGERLFLETRFAQAYYANPGKADPVLDKTQLVGSSLKGPFTGKTMNCRSCHMVDEHADNPAAGMRSYSDYAQRPPVPVRDDQQQTSPRNSQSLVNISIPREHGNVFHYDGQFNSIEDLVVATLSGRNFGWKADEYKVAVKHIATIIREDNGKDELGQEFGGSYRKVLNASAKDIPAHLRLPAEYRLDVSKASDQQVVDAVAKLIAAYVADLSFEMDDKGQYIASPYDAFLALNNLPRQPEENESIAAYNTRLNKTVQQLKNPRFVKKGKKTFASHEQNFVFAEKELEGMKIFFNKASGQQSGGNCASCHSAPHFSDFGFHNTGITQHNYDAIHDYGAFMKLDIPGLEKRNKHYTKYLPATTKHPQASSRYRSITAKSKPGVTDLGLWNVYANPDMPAPQEKLQNILCQQNKLHGKTDCSQATLLESSIAAFKTPTLRDLGHSGPYMHTGQFNELTEVITFYMSASALAKAGQLKNPAIELKDISLTDKDVEPMLAFLKALNEDYE